MNPGKNGQSTELHSTHIQILHFSDDFIRKEHGLWMLCWLEAMVERWSVQGRELKYGTETEAEP